jgi:hypothetical protein
MTTISGLPPKAAGPLTGLEVIPADQSSGGLTERFTSGDVASLGESYAALNLAVFPERFDAAGTYFTTQRAGDPFSTWFPPSIVVESSYGYVAQVTGGLRLYTRGALPMGLDRIYEVEAEIDVVSVGGGETPYVRVGMASLKADFTATDATPDSFGAVVGPVAAGGAVVVRGRFSLSAPAGGFAVQDPSTAILFRPFVEVALQADASAYYPSTVTRIRRLTVRDVTALVLAKAAIAALRAGNGDDFHYPTAKGLYDANAPVSMAFAAPLVVDLTAGMCFDLSSPVTSNFVLANPTGLSANIGKSGRIRFAMDSTGGWGITSIGSVWAAGGSPGGLTLNQPTSAPNAVNAIYYYVRSATEVEWNIARDFKA